MSGTSKPTNVMETLLFDLDGTLYPLDNGYPAHVVSERWVLFCVFVGVLRGPCSCTTWCALSARIGGMDQPV